VTRRVEQRFTEDSFGLDVETWSGPLVTEEAAALALRLIRNGNQTKQSLVRSMRSEGGVNGVKTESIIRHLKRLDLVEAWDRPDRHKRAHQQRVCFRLTPDGAAKLREIERQ
jgi:hypothetical protein